MEAVWHFLRQLMDYDKVDRISVLMGGVDRKSLRTIFDAWRVEVYTHNTASMLSVL